MRLRRLDLTRYGKFTDFSLDFGPSGTRAPDLHVIYGPNEAGKSTLFAAVLDLLFGMGMQSDYAFIHPYATMRIGAALEFGGEVHEFARVKRARNTLLDRHDQPMSDGIILGALGGIDRASYETMFSLDDETLEAGGKSILASRGDLGQLLFSASAGLADLSRDLDGLKAETERFYKLHARTGELLDLKAKLTALKTDREAIDTLATAYARLVQERDQAEGLYDGTVAARGLILARMDDIRRQLSALPRLQALRRLTTELVPYEGLPDAPRHWASELPTLQKVEIELDLGTKALAREIDDLVAEHDALAVDDLASRLVGRVKLFDMWERQITADTDLPKLRLQSHDAGIVIATILVRIDREGEAEPQRLLLKAPVVGALQGLIESRSGVAAASRVAGLECKEARHRLAAAKERLEASGPRAGGVRRAVEIAALHAAVAAARAADHTARRGVTLRARDTAEAALADRLNSLRPWDGTADDLAALPVPDVETIERWRNDLAAAQDKIDRHGGDLERFTGERLELEASLAALGATTGLLSDRETDDLRAARNEAWKQHRQTLDPISADAFDAALRRDDAATGVRFTHVGDLAKLRQAGQSLAGIVAKANRAAECHAAALAGLQTTRAEIAVALAAISPALPTTMTLRQIDTWIAQRSNSLDARQILLAAERDLRGIEADAEIVRTRLGTALAQIGVPLAASAELGALLAEAQIVLDGQAQDAALAEAVEERQRDLALRERTAEGASDDERRWHDAWSKACASGWLAAQGGIPDVGMVREILLALGDLGPALEKQNGLAYRIRRMEEDQAAFRAEVADRAALLDMPFHGREATDVAQDIEHRVARARINLARRQEQARKLDERRERLRERTQALVIHRRHAGAMTGHFGVDDLADVGRKLADLDKRDSLRRQADAAARDILDALHVSTLDEAALALDTVDREVLEAERGELQARLDDLDKQRLDYFSAHRTALDRVEAIGGDARVAEIEERRRTTLMEIEEGAVRYLKLRAGIIAAEQALRIYRDRHRGSMMKTASDAFRTISRGVYAGLATQPGKDGDTLIAVAASGGSKNASELSKGTRFQLYLALRVAGYHEFARSRQTVPFVADDIMETFDDFRAEETFRLFADMAGVGQVIYLTHHRHLCDIARSVCPSATIHDIGAR